MRTYRPDIEEKAEILDDLIRRNVSLSPSQRRHLASTLRSIADGVELGKLSDCMLGLAAKSAVEFAAGELLVPLSVHADNKIAC